MQRPATFLRRSLVLAALATAAFAAYTSPAGADVTCTRVAAPGGSDSAAGTVDAPYATVQRLVSSLHAGDTGCLRAGTYHEQNITLNNSGSGDDSRLVLTSYPGERATIAGRLYITDNADYVTVEDLNLDGHDSPTCSGNDSCRLPSPTVNGDHVIFQNNDVTNDHRGICFNLGNAGYGRAEYDTIRDNRIHDCGKLPAANHEHGIYLAAADDTQILDNIIYNNADRGIQLYPDAQRSTIRGNIIDSNGEGIIFSGLDSVASNDNVVEHNIITNAKIRYNVESWYPGVIGQRNIARNNCLYGGARGNVLPSQLGFHATDNVTADPDYANPAAGDFRVRNEACARVLAGGSPPVTSAGNSGSGSGSQPQGGNGGSSQPTHIPGGGGGGGTPAVTLSRAFLRHSRGDHRWRIALRGHFATRGLHRAIIQIRRGGDWETLAVRHLARNFKISVDARIPGVHAAVATAVRVIAPGIGRSHRLVARRRR